MITISINEETETNQDMAFALRHIADLIENGYTSGIGPSWNLEGEEQEVTEP